MLTALQGITSDCDNNVRMYEYSRIGTILMYLVRCCLQNFECSLKSDECSFGSFPTFDLSVGGGTRSQSDYVRRHRVISVDISVQGSNPESPDSDVCFSLSFLTCQSDVV